MIGQLTSKLFARSATPKRTSIRAAKPTATKDAAPAPRVASPPRSFGAGTYNLAAGNKEYSKGFDRTKRLAAQQIVSGEVSVMALQEVGVNGRNTRGRDNNEEILEEVFRQELPRDFRGADIDKVSLDSNGQPVMRDGKPVYSPERYADSRYTATNDDGATQNMTLTRDRFDSEGREVPFETSAEEAPTVAYFARLEKQDKTYSLTYASNNKEGSYGNSVLLAPGYEVEDAQQQVLGHDPDGEQRSALAVTFRTPEGQEGTSISAHLSNGVQQDQGDARVSQLRALSRFSDDYDNAIILGDFNTHPGKEYGRGLLDVLPFIDPDKTPSASALGLVDPDAGVRSIDRIFTQGEVSVAHRTELEQSAGGSDHPLVSWDVTLSDTLRQTYALAS